MISILTYSARWQQHKEAYALSTIRFTHKTMMTMKMNKKQQQQQAFLCFRLLFRASAPLLPLLLSIYQSPKSGNEIRSIFSLSISLSLYLLLFRALFNFLMLFSFFYGIEWMGKTLLSAIVTFYELTAIFVLHANRYIYWNYYDLITTEKRDKDAE